MMISGVLERSFKRASHDRQAASGTRTVTRVAFLIRSLEIGGAQRQLVALANGLHGSGQEVCVLTFYPDGALLEELLTTGVSVVNLDKQGRWDLLPFFLRLVRALRRERPATLYSFMPVANILAVLARVLVPGARIVWGVRASNVDLSCYDWLSRWTAVIEESLARFADRIIANSEAGRVYHAERGFPVDKMLVVPNGIDSERFRFDAVGRRRVRVEWSVKDDEMLIGICARLDPMKGYETFLKAASLLGGRGSNVRFVCVGDGPLRYQEELVALCRALGIADRVIWAGSRRDMPAVYSAFDIASSTSYHGEGFSNAVAEAMSCARICAVTDVGDSASIVGVKELVVPAKDAEALARLWGSLRDATAGKRQERGDWARERIVRLFSVQNMVTRTLQVLG
jgi:glycosyltransferase involved in cell wall biosynthesis